MVDDFVRSLKDHYVRDLQKKEISKFERAAIIKSVLEDEKISAREFGRRYGIPYGTVEDWLLYNKISEEAYVELQSRGLTASAIYRKMRKERSVIVVNALDVWANECSHRARGFRSDKVVYHSAKSVALLEKLVNDVNQLIVHINLYEKRRIEVLRNDCSS